MATSILDKFRREIGSFYALAMLNIAFGAVAMALEISFGVQNVLALVEGKNLLLPQLAFAIIGLLAFGISLRWLLSSVEVLDGITDIKNDYEEKTKSDDENTTGLIVKMMAHYRDNKSTIHRLSLLSRIAGVCFLASGIVQLLSSIIAGTPTFDIAAVAGSILSLGVGSSGIIIPHFFKNYSSVWEYRLQQSVEAERELNKELEGEKK